MAQGKIHSVVASFTFIPPPGVVGIHYGFELRRDEQVSSFDCDVDGVSAGEIDMYDGEREFAAEAERRDRIQESPALVPAPKVKKV